MINIYFITTCTCTCTLLIHNTTYIKTYPWLIFNYSVYVHVLIHNTRLKPYKKSNINISEKKERKCMDIKTENAHKQDWDSTLAINLN